MNIGLVLEGGGARGAYHMGATKLLLERKYKIAAVVGTSIGAVNAAMIAQNKFEKAVKIWESLAYSTLFDIEDEKLVSKTKRKINIDILKYLSVKISDIFKAGGISTDKMRQLLEANIDESKVRKSKINFGLATYSITDRKELELFIDQIPDGMLIEYIMASARLPGFKLGEIEGKHYLDGGVQNNCPLNMLVDKGYKDIFVIRVGSVLGIKNIKEIRKKKDLNITYIEPRDRLPNILSFNSETANYLLKLGYFDAVRTIDNLDGYSYYINQVDEQSAFKAFTELEIPVVNTTYKLLGMSEENYGSRNHFFEKVLPYILKQTNVNEEKTYTGYLIAMAEHIAEKQKIEKFKIYDLKELLEIIRANKKDVKKLSKVDQAIYLLIDKINI